ncbi:hypothetical protein G9A89_020296 [Geosiphon pyriformis]|nr:hypothetical protein G9A89_020296 [Geosiphon pyriformis]
MESKVSNVNGLSDLENIKNTVAEETSYADLDASVVNNIKDNTMSRKTHTCTYMLDQPPKTPLFDILSDNKIIVALLFLKFTDVHIFTSGLDKRFLNAGVTMIMNNSLAHHVFRVKKVPSCVILVQFLFINKFLVTILELYAGVSLETRFGQTLVVNSLIAKTVNFSTFVVLGKDFNKNGSGRSASFKYCLDLGLVNLFAGHYLVKTLTWCNSKEVEKTIDYIFVNENLLSTVISH